MTSGCFALTEALTAAVRLHCCFRDGPLGLAPTLFPNIPFDDTCRSLSRSEEKVLVHWTPILVVYSPYRVSSSVQYRIVREVITVFNGFLLPLFPSRAVYFILSSGRSNKIMEFGRATFLRLDNGSLWVQVVVHYGKKSRVQSHP